MGPSTLIPRLAEKRLLEGLADTPAVLIHGPRQCGKTTLAQMVGGPRGYAYFSFDDDVLRGAAEADPVGFVAGLPEQATLDEVQRVPGIFPALKISVDRRRTPGRFLLTGSANVLLVPRLAETLAGRMEILRLYPLAQCEIEGRASRFLDALFAGAFATRPYERMGPALAERIVGGGFPSALARETGDRRAAWYRNYVETMVQRDVRGLGRMQSLDVLPRLLALASAETARLLNVSGLASPFQISRPTIRDYLTLLERVFLLELVPPWHSNRLSRLVKTPKAHIGDTGLGCAILGLDTHALARDRAVLGQFVETFAYQELRRAASGQSGEIRFHHFRDRDGAEVDIVLERSAGEVAGVEVKAGATVTARDFGGLRKLRDAVGGGFAAGVVLYDGEASAGFGDRLFAVPIRALWEMA